MASPKKARSIRLQVINETGSMTNMTASRSASVNDIIELLMLGARDLIPDAPNEAIHVWLKEKGSSDWELELERGELISKYKQLCKKAARVKVTLNPAIMAGVEQEKSIKEDLLRKEEEEKQLIAAERKKLDWSTLGYALLLEARESDRHPAQNMLTEKEASTKENESEGKEGKEEQKEEQKEDQKEEEQKEEEQKEEEQKETKQNVKQQETNADIRAASNW